MTLVPTNESKEIITNYEELWSKIKNLISSINKNSAEINCNPDGKLLLNKTIEIHCMIIVVRVVFHKKKVLYTSFLRRISIYITNNIKMLYYDKIEVSEGIDVNKTSESKKRDICHYWFFLDKGFKFQSYVCNGCHDLSMISMSLSDIAILNIKSSDYSHIISRISKSEAINLIQNIDLTEKIGTS